MNTVDLMRESSYKLLGDTGFLGTMLIKSGATNTNDVLGNVCFVMQVSAFGHVLQWIEIMESASTFLLPTSQLWPCSPVERSQCRVDVRP